MAIGASCRTSEVLVLIESGRARLGASTDHQRAGRPTGSRREQNHRLWRYIGGPRAGGGTATHHRCRIRTMADTIARLIEGYGFIGFVAGLWLVGGGAARLDPLARGASWGFRVMVVPAGILLWPWLLVRLMRGGQAPPSEVTAHRPRPARSR